MKPRIAPRGGRVVGTREGYDRWSAVYDTDGNPLTALEEPVVRRLLGPVRGRRLLDVGCGTGRHALELARAGARVTAVDFSEGMLAQARRKPGASRVRFVRHDLAERVPLPAGAFDVVLSCLVLEHIRRLDPFFAELARLCRRGGRVVVSAMHPAMVLRGTSARFVDPETGRRVLPRSHPQTVADYVNAAARAGLRVEVMEERAATPALARRHPRARKYLGWPMLVAFRLAHEAGAGGARTARRRQKRP